ncbi:hypothetical protein REH65_32195 [Saccharopolyspora sp. ID03-671]|uniref:hypothetical protein n=1 Tax=Saccharopolyspora sp. ID03-671 TaxID=3073066 RepID=UPI003250D28C
MTPRLELFPIVIGRYSNPSWGENAVLPVDDEITHIAEQLAFFDAPVVDWEVPEDHRDDTAIMHRREEWVQRGSPCSLLYWAGHGFANQHTATLAHTHSPNPVGADGVSAAKIADTIARRTVATDGWHIVVIDTCHSAKFVQTLSPEIDRRPGTRRVLLVGTSGDGTTTLGRFSEALEPVLSGTFRNTAQITVWEFEHELRKVLPEAEVVLKKIDQHAVLKRRRGVPLIGPVDEVSELDAALNELTPDEQRHFLPKAQGAELGEQSWYFEGRETESERIATWLRTTGRGLLAVTGRASSGKSALLGHLAVQSRPGLRGALAAHGRLTDAPVELRPPDDCFDVVLHLAGLSSTGVIARLAADTGLGMPPVGEHNEQLRWLIEEITVRVRARESVTVLADALDEAQEPAVTARLLRMLADLDRVRVVVSTRANTREGPDRSAPDDHDLLDALGSSPRDTVHVTRSTEAITEYVRVRLSVAADRGLLPGSDDPAIRATAFAIGSSTQHEFLFARLTVHEILASGQLPDGMELDVLLRNTHSDPFASAVARLTRANPASTPVLRAFTFARGRGAPIAGGIAATIASAMHEDGPVTTPDVHTVLATAAPYVLVDEEQGETVYRLAHHTFAESFTSETHPTTRDRDAHQSITSALLDQADRSYGPLSPYVVHHLSGHASAAGRKGWETLATNTTVLDQLDPTMVSADAMRSAFGFYALPPAIGVLGASHLTAATEPAERQGSRQLAMARHTPTTDNGASEPRGAHTAWLVQTSSLRHRRIHRTIAGHTDMVKSVAVVPLSDGRTLLATGSNDETVRLWYADSQTLFSTLAVGFAANSVTWLGGKRLALGTYEGFVVIALETLDEW